MSQNRSFEIVETKSMIIVMARPSGLKWHPFAKIHATFYAAGGRCRK